VARPAQVGGVVENLLMIGASPVHGLSAKKNSAGSGRLWTALSVLASLALNHQPNTIHGAPDNNRIAEWPCPQPHWYIVSKN
jgi:hypothetical protein